MMNPHNNSQSTPTLARRSLAKGSAWAIPAIALASAAPAMAASNTPCLSLVREGSGDRDICHMGLWTNSNTGGAVYPTTLQTKPQYDCACTPLTYCDSTYPASVTNVTVSLAIPTCYKISPQTDWKTDASGTPWTIATGTTTIGGADFTVINVKYLSIDKYRWGQQIQIPLSTSGCTKSTFVGPRIYSSMSSTCDGVSQQSPWHAVGTSIGTTWNN